MWLHVEAPKEPPISNSKVLGPSNPRKQPNEILRRKKTQPKDYKLFLAKALYKTSFLFAKTPPHS